MADELQGCVNEAFELSEQAENDCSSEEKTNKQVSGRNQSEIPSNQASEEGNCNEILPYKIIERSTTLSSDVAERLDSVAKDLEETDKDRRQLDTQRRLSISSSIDLNYKFKGPIYESYHEGRNERRSWMRLSLREETLKGKL
ncbi:unnamed protein product, partial [Iphiclides podalirius]